MEWLPAPQAPRLTESEVHVWRFRLDQPQERLERLSGTLDAAEMARAGRFHLDIHRRRFIIRRGLLRLILARYLDLLPAGLTFTYGEFGRPELVDSPGLRYNASHSNDLGIAAVTHQVTVGVDIERIRPEVNHLEIAGRFFSTAEQQQLSALPEGQRALGFFLGWTRKEAYIKALGIGLSLPLDRFDVSLVPGAPARLLAARGELPGPEQVQLFSLDPGPGYIGALCITAGERQVLLWDIQDR